MFVARWRIDARFGRKQTVIDLLRRREIGGNPSHASWGKELEPCVVSGSSLRSIFRQA